MTENEQVPGTTRQTVDVPFDLMNHFDSIKRRRGHRSFGSYVVSLIESDMKHLNVKHASALRREDPEGVMTLSRDTNQKIGDALERIFGILDELKQKIDAAPGKAPAAITPKGKRGGDAKAS